MYTQTKKSAYRFRFRSLLWLILFLNATPVNSAQYFINPTQNRVVSGISSLGFGYYDEPVVYRYKEKTADDVLSHYKGFFVKYTRSFDNNLALHLQYLRAKGHDLLWSAGGALVYGFNLAGPGIGIYGGVAYTLKSRYQLTGEKILEDEKRWGLDYPIGVQIRNGQFTLSVETRYRNFVLDSGEVDVKDPEYPLYFAILMNF